MTFICDCGQTFKAWIEPYKKYFCRFCNTELRQDVKVQLSLYAFVPGSIDMSLDDVSRIKGFLSNRPGVFFKSSKLNDVLKLNDKGSCPKIRKAITLLIFQGFPVISTVKGFSVPKNNSQIVEYIKSLEGRRDAIDKRITALQKITED